MSSGDWLRSLAVHHDDSEAPGLSMRSAMKDAAYLVRIAGDGTLAAAFTEMAATEPELTG